MWLKKIFHKGEGSTSNNQQVANNPILSSKFEIEQEQDFTSPLVDNIPDKRYEQYESMPHSISFKFPKTILHHSQIILIAESDIFYGSYQNLNNWVKIDILITDRQLVFTPNILQPYGKQTLNFYCINYGYIEKSQLVVSNKTKKQPTKLKLFFKDGRQLNIRSVLGDLVCKINQIIHKFGFVNGINKFYAFRYFIMNKKLQIQNKGWQVYDIKKQFKRQGLRTIEQKDHILPLKYVNNINGVLSHTYPQYLVIPAAMSSQQLKKCASFRTKQRFPALTYILEYKSNKFSTLFRCSQNKVGVMSARSKEDEAMIKYIGQVTHTNSDKIVSCINCKIYDARGYYAALGNMFAGKGYQKPDFYRNCQIQWLDIPNIHAVRDSYNRIMSLKDNQNYLNLVAESGWYDCLYLIITGSKSIAIDLLNGTNVVVHCSDGWDRTSQLCAISQLIIDPFYRTIQGLAVLVEKDWRNFGHKFRERTGQFHPTNYKPFEKSPIFIQFLDCIRQIMDQFPLSFQYNDRLLLFLAKNVDTNIYGTFMTSNIQEGKSVKIKQSTISIWSAIKENIQIYKSPYYRNDLSQVWLNVSTETKNIVIWKQFFLGNDAAGGVQYHMMRQNIQINRTLKNQYFTNEKLIQQLQKEIQSLTSGF